MKFLLFLSFLGPATAAATPANQAFCNGVNSIVTAFRAQSTASTYCSSYLHIPLATTTVYTATTTAFPTDYACFTNPPSRRDAIVEERGKPPVSKPSCLKPFPSGPLISSACSCLSVSTSTTTTYATQTTTRTSFAIKADYNNLYAFREGDKVTLLAPYPSDGLIFSLTNSAAGGPNVPYLLSISGTTSSFYQDTDGTQVRSNEGEDTYNPAVFGVKCYVYPGPAPNGLNCTGYYGGVSAVISNVWNLVSGQGTDGVLSNVRAVPVVLAPGTTGG